MRGRIIGTIAAKELLESFRDRRTLFLMVFLPILLYPALLLIITQVAVIQQSKLAERTSVVAYRNGSEDHPLLERLRADDQFELIELHGPHPDRLGGEGIDAIIDLDKWPAQLPTDATARLRIRYESIEESSRQAADRLEDVIVAWRDAELTDRLNRLALTRETIEPVDFDRADLSPPEARGGYTLGAILPLLVIATVLLGAYYPAIDLTAGEKERGSIQTLFTAPITPFEVVAGKYLAVLGIALVSGMANLLSMALLFSQNLFLGPDRGGLDLSMTAPVVGCLFIAIVVMALFFSSLLLTVAVLARSYKEGQNYITPVYLALFVPAAIAQMPGFELTPELAVVPGINVTLLMKEILVEGPQLDSLFLVSASSVVFTLLVLVLASRLFAQEQVILGERGSLSLLTRRRPGDPQRRPTVGEGVGWYGVLFILLFYGGTYLQSRSLEWGLLATLWVLLLLPTLVFTGYLRLDFRQTFHLRRPGLRPLVAAVILGASAWIVVAWLNSFIDERLFAPPPELEDAMESFLVGRESLGEWLWLLVLIALSPAICEEAMFRGFVFSSLRQRVPAWALIGLTALMFGAFHLSAFRLFGTTMLGVVMGLLVYKSGSIFTSAVFHFVSNAAVVVVLSALPAESVTGSQLPDWLLACGAGGVALGLVLLAGLRSPFGTAGSLRRGRFD